MPTKRKQVIIAQRGSGPAWDRIKSIASSLNNFLKRTKIISTVGNALGPVIPVAGQIGRIAGANGYGRRRPRRTGAGLKLAGGARRAPAKKKRVVRRRRV